MWWQGEETAPDVIKLCLASIRRHCGAHRLVIITEKNYQDFITLPEHITAKVNKGVITLTHLSDIIRVNLLKKYGGLWLDSSLFAAKDIPEEVFSSEYYTIKRVGEPDYSNHYISFSRWAIYLLAAQKTNSRLFSFMTEFLSEYWKDNDKVIDYTLFDYIMAIAFEDFPEFRQAWENLPVNNTDCWTLVRKFISRQFDAQEYSQLISSTTFFKLTYKDKFALKTPQGQETFYGHLLAEYNISH